MPYQVPKQTINTILRINCAINIFPKQCLCKAIVFCITKAYFCYIVYLAFYKLEVKFNQTFTENNKS